jgi:mono/diheme cytochrome c family protein
MPNPLQRLVLWLYPLAIALAARSAHAQDAPPTHGWRARFESLEGGGSRIETIVPAAALALEHGQSPCVGLGATGWSNFEAAAQLELPRSGRYRFGLELWNGNGDLYVRGSDRKWLPVEVKGAAPMRWSEWITLPALPVDLVVSVAVEPAAPVNFRAWWEMAEENGRGFRAEPIPLRAVTPVKLSALNNATTGWRPAVDSYVEARDLALLANKGCQHCHAGELPGIERASLRAPELARIAERVDLAWLEQWTLAPSRLLAHADMPTLFGDSADDRERVRDLVHYLAPEPIAAHAESAAATADIERGLHLYHDLGCIGCHGAKESPAVVLGEAFLEQELPSGEPHRVLPDLAAKWRRAGLEAFLLDPVKFHPGGRMPSFLLDANEARALAAYLVPREPARAEHVPDPVRAARGAETFKERGCNACHLSGGSGSGSSGLRAPLDGKSMLELDASKPCSGTRYDLRDGESGSLARAWSVAALPSTSDAPSSHAGFAYERNQCGGCHSRAGDEGIAYELRSYFRSEYEETDLGDEGRLPPDLGGVGTKLHAAWIQHVLDTGARARPYLRARMPVFASTSVAGLGEALARSEGVLPGTDAAPPACDDEQARIGRDLLGREQLSCIACHTYKDYPPNGTPGAAIERFTERLRYEWFRAFLPDPARAKPGTRMPTFGQAGKSSLTRVHGGDVHAQVDAMWCYFALAENAPVPPGVQKQRSLEVVVGDKPIVLRTFLEQTGPRGIAVGYPNGLSFAYDAGNARLVDAWKGPFLDASGPWAERGGNNADGQGPKVWQAPPGPPLVFGALPEEWPTDPRGWSWRGYQLHEPKDGPSAALFEAQHRSPWVLRWEGFWGELLPRPKLTRIFALSGDKSAAVVCFRGGRGEQELKVSLGELLRRVERDGEVYYELRTRDGALEFQWEVRP